MSTEDIPVRNSPLGQRIHQRDSDMFLTGDISKPLRPVFSRKHLMSHEGINVSGTYRLTSIVSLDDYDGTERWVRHF